MLSRRQRNSLGGTLLVLVAFTLTACHGPACRVPGGQRIPQRLVTLPDYCNTPDGMCLLPDDSIILSVPNYNDDSQPPVLMKIAPDNLVSLFYRLPVHPETGRIGPMGIAYGPDGNLYLADNQYFWAPQQKSRLLKITLEQGRPVRTETIVDGFFVANAVYIRDGYIYVSDTVLDPQASPVISGVFRFRLGEKATIQTPALEDPHLIATIETHNPKVGFGADGLTMDNDGRLYVGNFGDGTLHRLTFDRHGRVKENIIFAQAPHMKCCDGIFFDSSRYTIYVADSILNAVQAVCLDGTVTTLARNGDTDGADGGMDQPCEVIVRGDQLITSNMDWPVGEATTNRTFDWPYTLSVIELDP